MNDIHSLVHGYVVDALEPDETREFEAHLATCDDCQHEMGRLQEVTAAMAAGVSTEPPESLRASVLNAIAQTPQEPAVGDERRSFQTEPNGATVTPIDRGAARGSRRWTALLAAAAVLAAVGFGAWAIQSRHDLESSREDYEAAAAQNEQLARLLAAEDVQLLTGEFASGGDGVVVLSEGEGTAMLLGLGLEMPPEGQVYEAWTIEGEDAAPAGLFSPDPDQPAVVELPDAAFDAEAVAVTVEPAGGSTAPTTEPVFAVTIPT
jgi:anti-sigma-K factor RskA